MLIEYTKIFFHELGGRLLLLFGLLLFAAVAEALGVVMLLPLLQSDSGLGDDILSRALDSTFRGFGVTPTIGTVLVFLVGFFIFRGIFLVAQSWYQAVIISDHLVQLRSRAVSAIFQASYPYLLTKDVGYLTNALTGEAEKVNFSLRQLINLMVFTTTSLVYVILPLLFQPVLTLFLIGVSVPVIGVMVVLNRLTREASVSHTYHAGRQQTLLVESIRNTKYFKATGRSSIIVDRVLNETRRLGKLYRRLLILGGVTRYAFEPLVVIGLAGIVLYYTRILDEPMTEVLFLLFLFYQASKSLLQIQPSYRKFIQASGSLELHRKLNAELDENAISDDSDKVAPPSGADISLRDVSVSYPSRGGLALKDVSITIPNGATVAFVGPSGSGKTTLANVICGLLEPSQGNISLGDTAYKNLQVRALQRKIAYVTQEPPIFSGTVTDNVTLWEENPDRERVERLLLHAGLQELFERRNGDKQAEIGGDGINLSGGERQRLSIARELYRDFDLLILDEATSSLDSGLERRIDELLAHERGKKTIIVIAHRLATVKSADTIFVLENGSVVEQGDFIELYEANGSFRQMVDLQKL